MVVVKDQEIITIQVSRQELHVLFAKKKGISQPLVHKKVKAVEQEVKQAEAADRSEALEEPMEEIIM